MLPSIVHSHFKAHFQHKPYISYGIREPYPTTDNVPNTVLASAVAINPRRTSTSSVLSVPSAPIQPRSNENRSAYDVLPTRFKLSCQWIWRTGYLKSSCDPSTHSQNEQISGLFFFFFLFFFFLFFFSSPSSPLTVFAYGIPNALSSFALSMHLTPNFLLRVEWVVPMRRILVPNLPSLEVVD